MFEVSSVAHAALPEGVQGPAIVAFRGLPASGKSSLRVQLVQSLTDSGVQYAVVSRDDTRLGLGDLSHRPAVEKKVTALCSSLSREALASSQVLISDNTNLSKPAQAELVALAREFDCPLIWVDLTHVSVSECVKRDASRHVGRVGELVIRRMWRSHLAPRDPGPAPAPGSPSAVIFDVDGTLARMVGRSPYEWAKVLQDEPVDEIVELVRMEHAAGYSILVVSGRDGSCFDLTHEWLVEHLGVPFTLYMRAPRDTRPDDVVKGEIFHSHISSSFFIRRVYDDRRRVVDLWRYTLGLTCLQVADFDE